MPGAVTGEDDGFQYLFTIHQKIIPVQNFYLVELPKTGWNFDKAGTGYLGEPLLTFKKGDQVLGVSIAILSVKEDLLIVTLALP